MPNLFNLKGIARELSELIDQEGLTQEVEAKLEQISQMGISCVAIFASLLDEYEMRAKIRKEKGKELTDLAKKDSELAARQKELIKAVMATTGQKKVELGGLTATLSPGSASTVVDNEDIVPPQYKSITLKIRADKLDLVKAVLDPENILSESSPEVSLTLVKKASDENIGVNGTRIEKGMRLTLKGAYNE